MRVSLQGCLILWLCFLLPGTAFSADTTGLRYYNQNCKGAGYDYGTPGRTWLDEKIAQGYTEAFYWEGLNSSQNCWVSSAGACPATHPYYTGNRDQNGNPICSDTTPSCPAGEEYDTGLGECVPITQTPNQCREQGLAHDPATGTCVETCEHGILNGACLSAPIEQDTCDSDSDDYRGELVTGYGSNPIAFCGDYDQCSGEGGSVGVVNGEVRCIADDYGQPSCKGGSITVIDEYGFICEPLANAPQPEQPTPEPNTDTDGDGQPDEYQRENDPDAINKGLDAVTAAIESVNKNSESANQRLSKISDQLGANTDALNEGLGTANETLSDISEKMDGPDGGYSTDTLGDADTFEATTNRLQGLITQNATIQAVTTIPTIAENNTCPVWTIPATDYWSAMPLDVHCDILNNHRGLLSMLFVAAWTLAAIFVFLRA